MNKFTKLLNKIEKFCSNALCSFLLIKRAEEGENGLLDKAEDFDIKNEELFNQFEGLLSAYKELTQDLQLDPTNLNQETFEQAGQLIDTLNKRYERIMSNPYLNGGEDFDEDFDPGDFTQYIQDLVEDAEQQLKNIAGEDVDIDEMRANQYAQEFNDNKNIDRGDQNIRWTGDKVQQGMEARKKWYQNLMFVKKVGKSHPDYARYENFVQRRRDNFKRMLDNLRENDPVKWRAFQDKMNEKVRKHYHRTIDKQRIKHKEKAKKIKEVKEGNTLEGHITHLKQRLATAKSEVVKSVKSRAAKDPFFAPYKQAVAQAKKATDSAPTPANKQALDAAILKEAEVLKQYLDNHELVNKAKEDLAILYAFRDKAKQINETGWVSEEGIPEEVKPHLLEFINEGEGLIKQFNGKYRTSLDAVYNIINFIKQRL